MTHHSYIALLLICLLVVVGCEAPLPTYAWEGMPQALQRMSERSAGLRFASGTATVGLRRADGAGVRVDAAFAAHLPRALRIRMWKMDRAVADWTLREDGVWLWQAEQVDQPGPPAGAGPWAGHHARVWPMMFGIIGTGGGGGGADDELIDGPGSTFTVRRALGAVHVEVVIDKPTLTVREFRVVDEKGTSMQRVIPRRYRVFGGLVWPMEVAAEGESGSFVIEFNDVTLNDPPPAGALEPSPRARLVR